MSDKQLGKYSLWLVPAEPESSTLSKLIEALSTSQAGSPIFGPHVTLVSPLKVTTDLEDVAATLERMIQDIKASLGIADLELDLQPAQTGEKYYQSVLSPVAPTAVLLALRKAVIERWGPRDQEYFPHLSLFYGDATQEQREKIAKRANGMHVDGSTAGWRSKIRVDAVVVVDTSGKVDKWKVVQSVKA